MSIVEKVKAIAIKQAENTEFSLYDVEYVKEGTEYFLRIYFDKDGGLTLDDCVLLSEKCSDIQASRLLDYFYHHLQSI